MQSAKWRAVFLSGHSGGAVLKYFVQRELYMKYIRIFLFTVFMLPFAASAAQNDFQVAAQLLAAAKSADIQQVQALVNNGADVNYVDSTGLSIVCTALMNNDVRAAQILQMYGADASKCDQQIKKYNSRNKPESSGGLFSGLSSAQSIALTAAGAAVVVGGLFLLTDLFDPGNDNDSNISSGDRNPGDSNGDDNSSAVAKTTLPYGPAMPNAESEAANFNANQNYYSPDGDADSILAKNFELMSGGEYKQNYLLMMHGYAPLARGYLGQRTLRVATNNQAPVLLKTGDEYIYKFDGRNVQGGRPVNVALVTENGINAVADSSLGYFDETTGTYNFMMYSEMNGDKVNSANNNMVFGKYYNNKNVFGTDTTTISDDSMIEDADIVSIMDLSGYGTAIHNQNASDLDNLLAKIVGGTSAGYSAADYMGFMPNGQMSIFRVGNGTGLVGLATADVPETGTITMAGDALAAGDSIGLFGKTLNVESVANSVNGNVVALADASDSAVKYSAYVGADGLLYIDSAADGAVDSAFAIKDGVLTQTKKLADIDYYNYGALLLSALRSVSDEQNTGRSKMDVLANTFVVPTMYATTTEGIDQVLAYEDTTARQVKFMSLIQKYYDNNPDDSVSPVGDAANFYKMLGSQFFPLVVFSTGASELNAADYAAYSGATYETTFESAAPLVYSNLEHLFMSVVPVGLTGEAGTSGTKSIAGYKPSSQIAVSQWAEGMGNDDTTDDKYYRGRVCGVAGTGAGGVDPWCFAAAGVTDEMAVASAAGAAGAVKSAFSYMTNDEVFRLLALTADGAYLGTNSDGTAISKTDLAAYLSGMYKLPAEYQFRVDNGADYLETFKEVFGYGLINLNRATTPNTKLFFYDGTNIVSANGNAYWRAAANTNFRASSVLNLNGTKISAPYYDMLSSVDGDMYMARVWENEFNFGSESKRALYMGDVLGELKTRDENVQRNKIGNVGFSMAVSERAYADNLNGLDLLSLDYDNGNWNFGASFQRYFTDGASRFDGMANPILNLASNVLVSDVEYKNGNWAFGGRAFSGMISDEGLMETDPTIASQYMPAKLGLMQGAQTHATYANNKFAFTVSVGAAVESDTLLGAYTDGLLNFGNGKTTYVDAFAKYDLTDAISLSGRATFARTTSDANGMVVLGLSDIDSNAFAIGANVGNFEFSVSQPLAISNGSLQYAHAEYDTVKNTDGNFDLVVRDAHVADIDLTPDMREVRFSGTYRHKFGEFTDGAVGFIYRVNPNHTDEFGNESIFMMKMTHRLGI